MKPFQKKIESLVGTKITPNITPVYIEEEFGFRDWLWFPKMNYKKLEKWWANLETISKLNMFQLFYPLGEMVDLYPMRKFNKIIKVKPFIYNAFVFDDTDSFLLPPKWVNNAAIVHKNYEEANRRLEEDIQEQLKGE